MATTDSFTHTWDGGQRTRIPHNSIEIRLKSFYHSKPYVISKLPIAERQKVVWVLWKAYCWTQPEIAALLKVSERTVIRDANSANFLIHCRKSYFEQCVIIDRYLLYNVFAESLKSFL